jgi:hypothetical protein
MKGFEFEGEGAYINNKLSQPCNLAHAHSHTTYTHAHTLTHHTKHARIMLTESQH